MSGQVIAAGASTMTDFFYEETDTNIDGSDFTGVAAFGGWPASRVREVVAGDLITVTLLLWLPDGESVTTYIGHFNDPDTFESDGWTALDPFRDGIFYSQSFYKVATDAMVAYGFIDVLLPQDTIDLDSGGIDGGQIYLLGWDGITSVANDYGIATTGVTTHTPDTANTLTANFYVGGGAVGDGTDTTIEPDPPDSSLALFTVLNDNRALHTLFQEEYYGVGFYQPQVELGGVGEWTTDGPQSAFLTGIGPVVPTISFGNPSSGRVRSG